MYVKFLNPQDKIIYEKLLTELFDDKIESEHKLEISEIKSEVPIKHFLIENIKIIDSTEDQDLESEKSEIFILNEDVEITSSDSDELEIRSPESFDYLFILGKVTNTNYLEILNLAKSYHLVGLYLEFDNYYLLRDEILQCFRRVYFKQLSDYNIIKYKIHARYYNYLPDVLALLSRDITPRAEINFENRSLTFILNSDNLIKADPIFDLLKNKDIKLKIVDSNTIHKIKYNINLILNNDILVTDNYAAIWLAIITATPVFIINNSREVQLLSAEIGISKFMFDDINDFSLKYLSKLNIIREKMSDYLASCLNILNNVISSSYFDNLNYENVTIEKTTNSFYLAPKVETNWIYKSLFKLSSASGVYLDFDLDGFDYPLLHHWLGFINSIDKLDQLLDNINFRSSLNMCKGLFTFDYQIKLRLDSRLDNLNCIIVDFPINKASNLTRYHIKSRTISLIAVLENENMIIILSLWKERRFKLFWPRINKFTFLVGKVRNPETQIEIAILTVFKIRLNLEDDIITVEKDDDLKLVIQLFDSMLAELFNRSEYNNVILLSSLSLEIMNEAIIRNIPIIVEKNSYNLNLLGNDYPLYYEKLDINHLPTLNLSNLKQAVSRLKSIPVDRFTFETLVKNLNNNINTE